MQLEGGSVRTVFRVRAVWALGLLSAVLYPFVSCAQEAGAEDPGQAQIDFANGLFNRGFFDEASEEYRKYTDEFPKGPQVSTALYRLGESESACQRYEAALDAFEKLLKTNIDETMRLRSQLAKGEALYQLKRLDDAEGALSPLTDPAIAEDIRGRALYYVGKLKQDAGNPDAAQQAFNTLIKELPNHALAPFARYQLAFVCLARNDLESAAIAFSEVATSNVDTALRTESRFRAAETYDKIGWFTAAVKEYERLQEEFPGSEFAQRAAYGYAWALYHAGKFAEASVAAEKFIAENAEAPQKVGILYLRGNCLQQQKQFPEAEKVYRQIQQDFPESEFAIRSRYKLAWVLYLSGNVQEAKQQAMSFLDSRENEALLGDAAFLLGTIEASEGNFEDAYEEFRLVAEKYAASEFGPEALYKAGECLAQLGRTEEAATVFENFAKTYPENALTEQAILRVGDARLSSDAFEDAVARYQKILESPDDPTVEENTLYRLAITYYNMKNYEASAAAFQKILDKFPASAYTAEARYRIGDHVLRDLKDPVKAIEPLEAAIAANPEGPFAGRALKGLALARYEAKDYDAAADLFLKLMANHPDVELNQETYAWVGQRCFDQQKWDASAQALESLLRANPDYANPERVRFKIAECSEAAGKAEQAAALFAKVVEAAPGSSQAIESLYRMGKLQEQLKNEKEAVRLYEEAANANTGDAAARARFRLGELYEQQGDFEAAAKSYMRVAILFLHEELSPESLWRAAQCFEKAEKPDQAIKTYKELVDGFPESEQAVKAKAKLEQG
ncbi:MAG: Tetratricopeptide repeat protein [Candidatus Hydrogenedentes bacterium]|nr:Tetratricopeptide repeat protein [Candidatus Hydrogenedentota bacterium]